MRQYPSNGGVLDSSELDPCIAAESRMKQSFVSSKMKKLMIILGVLCLLLVLLGLFFFIFGKSDDSIDYEEHEVQQQEMDPLELVRRTENVVQTPQPYIVTEPPSPSKFRHNRPNFTNNDEPTTFTTTYTQIIVKPVPTSSTTSTTSSTASPSTTASPATTRSFPTTTPEITTPQPSVSVRISQQLSQMQLEPSVIPVTSEIRRDCLDHRDSEMGSGIYLINPDGGEPFHVFCDMETDGGGWTVVQRRLNGDAPFYNYTFREYEEGFGELRTSHWLGLNYMHRLAPTGIEPVTLRIELRGNTCPVCNPDGMPDGFWWGEWKFSLGDARSYYSLSISETQLRGNLSNPQPNGKGRWEEMSNGQAFTTMDADNDESPQFNCAQFRSLGGWWHRDCTQIALNGRWGDVDHKMRYLVFLYDAPPSGRPGRRLRTQYFIHPRQTLMMLRPQL